MLKIALTGGIGCGKSTVCELFTLLNTPVFDTDIIARELVKPGQKALIEIVDYFGSDIIFSDESLNRKALAKNIFNNEKNRLHLESILHPKIQQFIQKKLDQLNACYVIIAIPLLLETKQQSNYDRVLLVDCEEQQQIDRTIMRDKRNLNEVQSIMRSQVSRKDRIAIADDIIDNTQEISTLKTQVSNLHNKYIKLCEQYSL